MNEFGTLQEKTVYVVSNWDMENNPYLMEWKTIREQIGLEHAYSYTSPIRWKLLQKYSFAVPDEQALRFITQYSPDGVLEIGAGTGYWAMLLSRLGADVVTYDDCSGKYGDRLEFGKYWSLVRANHLQALANENHRRTLFLCWPDYNKEWPSETIELYRGGTVIYVGEGKNGCTGNNTFHEILGKKWRVIETYEIPQWWGIYDRMFVYKRKECFTKVKSSK